MNWRESSFCNKAEFGRYVHRISNNGIMCLTNDKSCDEFLFPDFKFNDDLNLFSTDEN